METSTDRRKRKDRERRRKNLYGVSEEQWTEMKIRQDNRCAICSKHADENGQELAIDHCHDTGKVRGLLCRECNLALGYLDDNINLFANAIKYLNASNDFSI